VISNFQRELDLLDLEIVEGAFDDVSIAIKTGANRVDPESDEELEAALLQELSEMVRFSGVSDPDALRDVLVADMIDRWTAADLCGPTVRDCSVARVSAGEPSEA
jgi:hypothetical protein